MREGLIAIANNEDVEDVLEEEPVDCIENETDDELEDGIGDETQMDGDGISYALYCLRHFINNFNDKFRNSQLKALAYRAGSQNRIRKFNSIMEEIGKINRKARQWLEQHAFDKWTLAHDSGKRYGLLTTNLLEIFNSVLKGGRCLPITSCVQLTFYRLVHYFDVRRPMGSNAQANGDMYTPHILAK
uniref:Uncharacterized protein n=1 Tax=Helianthus annuus TaxID=4232 RepID=A0A251SCT1_HELAN